MPEVIIQPVTEQKRAQVSRFLTDHWGANMMVVHGVMYSADELPGFIACLHGELVGLITYHIEGCACEIVSLNSVSENRGIGTSLLEAVRQVAFREGCTRLWLMTTNDNLHALRFYQKRGFIAGSRTSWCS